jgi:N-methylhydantoinase A
MGRNDGGPQERIVSLGMAWRIGVDSGGTFTDVCLFDETAGRIAVWKVSSTPADP